MLIVFLVPYPVDNAPSQRFRFEQYFSVLGVHRINFEVYSFLSNKGWKIIYLKGRFLLKAVHLLVGFSLRIFHVFMALRSDFVFVHREITPIGPPVFEWLLTRIFKKKLIYDFDDAIWLDDINHKNSFLGLVKFRRKVNAIMKWSYKISAGNEFLCEYASRFNPRVVVNPTTIDTLNHHNPELFPKKRESHDVVIGWTGTHSTLRYLDLVERCINHILKTNDNTRFVVIANQRPANLRFERCEFRQWNEKTEISDLLEFDIGIMPLTDDDWSRGKCGFKGLQYMALGIPAVLSPVGVNKKIIDHGINGFLASDEKEWISILEKLVQGRKLRKQVGQAGRDYVTKNYSVVSNTDTFLRLFT